MSFVRDFFRRLSRALDTRSSVQVDERSLVGEQGEQYVVRIISDFVGKQGGMWLRGPLLLPVHYGKPQGEKDVLVYTRGSLFCVEVKFYRGSISYCDGYGSTKMQREKRGNYGEVFSPDYFDNPLRGTKRFINALKAQTARAEPRFGGLKIIPVVAFVRFQDTDISAIHSFEEGLIYAEDLPGFFSMHQTPRFAQRPSKWITHTISHIIPSWDWIITTRNEMVGGILTEQQLRFKDRDGNIQSLSFSYIHSIRWQRGSFSPYDEMTVLFTDGTTQVFYCVSGNISLQRYEEFYTFKMRNIQEIIVGVSNKLK